MSRLGAKTYSRKPDCKTSVQFDHLLSDKGNKPSTAKVSVAGIHRWGMTSFTSLRKSRINGQKEITETIDPVKRIKLDPTPPVVSTEDPFSFGTDSDISSNNTAHSPTNVHCPSGGFKTESKPVVPKPNKFFKSGSRNSKTSKNSDFDALRLSVPTNINSLKSGKDLNDYFVNTNSNFKSEVPHASEESPVYLTSTTPNIVNLRYCANIPNTCASTKYSNQPSVHYISSYVQPIVPTNTSSHSAFDSLLTLDLSNKPSNSSISHHVESPGYLNNDNKVEFSHRDILNNSVLNHHQTNVSHSSGYGSQPSKHFLDNGIHKDSAVNQVQGFSNNCKSDRENVLTSKPEREKLIISDSEKETPVNSQSDDQNNSGSLFSQSQTSTISEEIISSSQSSDRTDNSSTSSKQTTRPKKIFSSSLKFKAVYNHRHWHSSKKSEETLESQSGISIADEFEEEMSKENFNDTLVSEVSYTSSGDVRSFKCPKESKEFYTVVKNVKQAYQCHESGETQEFNDDIEYLLECVQECNAIGTRCLSVLNLAAKCMGPAFRIHLRAHGTMPKIFSALKDAPSDPNLALCTATLMFVLSQDRLTMDIEASTLSLMLQLLETDPELRNPDKEIDLILKDPALCAMQDKHREKVYLLCEEMQQKGHAKHLKLDNINTGILAMETLLSLTSRKAGEWFKEEMRTLRGLDRIADTVTSSTEILIPEERQIIIEPTEVQLDKIRKIDRCLRVLENVTHMNPENQEYLFSYKNSSLILSCLNLMRLCKSYFLGQKPVVVDMTKDEPSQKSNKDESPLFSCLLNLLKILSNITYRIPLNDVQFLTDDGFMDQILMLILQVPRAVPIEKRFDLLVLSLGLMINLVEYCPQNSAKFIDMCSLGSFDSANDGFEMPATEALIELMLSRLDAARLSEEQADELLSSQEVKHAACIEKKDVETAADDLEETLMKTLQKAGKHMEHSIIAAYIVILLGCVAQKNPSYIDVMKDYLTDGKFDVMVEVLKKFKSFVTLTGSVGNRELASIQRVIQVLESS
ncbi:wings apart-like protein homolog [Trichonephila inaurata madagascariensis]|uniref:Wings apart-like protein homolog n=1 Tax=Trichonephila inaurata madagascariensis TaxID=2747483 RepID=A0A8X6YHB3_9ARAC|nr:wings apart-like protein homolog [Trichonephila inaurata madagascariensis]